MSTATLSSKFQISIPKELREEMGFKPGQKFAFLRIGRTLKLVPQPTIGELFGLAEGAKTDRLRDRRDRDVAVRRPTTSRREKTGTR